MAVKVAGQLPETIRPVEACEILQGICRKTLYNLVRAGLIQSINFAQPGKRPYRRAIRQSVLDYAAKLYPNST